MYIYQQPDTQYLPTARRRVAVDTCKPPEALRLKGSNSYAIKNMHIIKHQDIVPPYFSSQIQKHSIYLTPLSLSLSLIMNTVKFADINLIHKNAQFLIFTLGLYAEITLIFIVI